MAADRVAVVNHHARVDRAQTRNLGLDRGMIGGMEGGPARLDVRDFAVQVERVVVERFGRAQPRRRLPRIERGARRIAVAVDHAARDVGPDPRRVGQPFIERTDMPVGIADRPPARAEAVEQLGRNLGPPMREGENQRAVAPFDVQPAHAASPGSAPTASSSAGERISAIAISMSGAMWRSSASVGTCARSSLRTASTGPEETSGAWKSQPCAPASSSLPSPASTFAAISARRRAPCAAIETWSSWLAEVGIESTLAG